MRTFVSIRTKLISNTMILIAVTFALLLSVITVTNIISVNKNIDKSKRSIRNALVAKGMTLAKNNSMAMRGMAEDNAFSAIQPLVSSTVAEDADIVYGIYMNRARIPWVVASAENPSGIPENRDPRTDSLSQWAGGIDQLSLREYRTNHSGIIEFAAPVISDDEILGFIRYGLSTRSMEQSIHDAQIDGKATRNQAIFIILSMGLLSLGIGYFVIKRLATKITQPIGALVNSSKVISEGNYDTIVTLESNDEIGDLASHFETMRGTIQRYTNHLQELIDEKMQQVNDILDNIDQGLFTINLDGSVNQEYSSRANRILRVKDVASCKIKDLLRFDTKQEASFYTWLKLVQKRHNQQRWPKLAKLAPVQEIELITKPDLAELEYVSISYQRIYDKSGNLAKIMVLAMDETEKKLKDFQMAAERLKHENDVKLILTIANTPAEEIAEFTEDTSARMLNIKRAIDTHIDSVSKQRDTFPNCIPYTITNQAIDLIFRDIHTIKGNGGSYGFEMLSHFAHQTESQLEKLRDPQERRDDVLLVIKELIFNMDGCIADIHKKIQLIFGKDEEITIRIPEIRIKSIIDISNSIVSENADENTARLIAECTMLCWKPLRTLVRKYQKLALQVARKLHRNIVFTVVNSQQLYPEDSVSDIDEILIHLIRNAVDHGIEAPEVREELGKGVGRIQLSLSVSETKRIITITDDGHGIDYEQLIERCIDKNILTPQAASTLSAQEKQQLIFISGISTANDVSQISGRGVGMDIINHKITSLNGSIAISSELGKGSSFVLTLPLKSGIYSI